jgi:hypothetical protein
MPSAMEANAPREIPNSGQQNLGSDAVLGERGQGAQQAQQQSQEQTPEESASTRRGGETTSIPWPALLLVPVLLLAAVPLAKRALLARGRPEDLYRDLTGRLRDVLPPGRSAIADSPALTPTERVLLLAGAAGLEEGPMEEFARAYSDHLYAAPRDASSRHVARAYRGAVRAYERLPRWRRALGAFNPASLTARARRGASAWRTRLRKTLGGRLRAGYRTVYRAVKRR